jgi:SAM-dependent methyltransferase
VEIAGVHRSATAFEGAATVYEHSRPGYPAEAVDWLTAALELGPGRRVVDLAAGTGKLTRALLGRGAEVIAVEPVAAMRETLAATMPMTADGGRVSVVAAVAQALPVADGRLDAVTVGQGFHWFATRGTVVELHRVIGSGGGLGLLWNHRDTTDRLQAGLTTLMEPWRGDTPSYDSGQWRQALEPFDLFGPGEEFHVSWRQPVDVEGVADRVASVSFIAAMSDTNRSRLLEDVRALAVEMPQPLSLAYVADVFVYPRMG